MHTTPVAYSTAVTRLTVPQLSVHVDTGGRSILQHTTLCKLFVCAILQGSGPSVLDLYEPDQIRKHWRSVTGSHPSSVCFTIDSSSQFSSPGSDQYACLHACSKNTVRLHASSLPAENPTHFVKGPEEVTYTLNHDTCIRPYDTIHATTPFPSLVCLFLLPLVSRLC